MNVHVIIQSIQIQFIKYYPIQLMDRFSILKIKNSSWEKYHNSDRFVDIDGSEEGVFTLLYENQIFFLGYIADKKKER